MLQEVFEARKVQVEHHKAMIEQLKKEEKEEMESQELVRLQNAQMTVQHEKQIKILKQNYAKDLLNQIELKKVAEVREMDFSNVLSLVYLNNKFWEEFMTSPPIKMLLSIW